MNSLKFVWKLAALLVPAVAVCLLAGCGGGSGGEDVDAGIRPSSLNGVTLTFQGAKLTFTTATPNTVSGGTEVGGIFYERTSEAAVVFTPADSGGLDAIELTWPVDLGGGSRYEYTPIDGTTGRLLVYSDNLEPDTIFQKSASFDTLVLTFTESGGVIAAIEAVMTVTIDGRGRFVSSFNPTGNIGGLSSSPLPLPSAWNGVNQGPGFVAVNSLNGKVLTLNQDGGDVEIQFGPFVASSGLINDGKSTKESGAVSVLVTRNLGTPGTETADVFEADYIQVQPFGTENVELQLIYRSGTTTLPDDETITLTFTGGERISTGFSTVEVRTGIYTRTDATFGTFILDTR